MYFFSFKKTMEKVDFFAQHNDRQQQEGHRFSCDLLCCEFCVCRSSFRLLQLLATVQILVCGSAGGCWPFDGDAMRNWYLSWVKTLLGPRPGKGSNTLKAWMRDKWRWVKQLYCDVATLYNESAIFELRLVLNCCNQMWPNMYFWVFL